jgi:hypothetical protein
MSDQGALSGTVKRKGRRKSAVLPKRKAITLKLKSKRRAKGTWDDDGDWPEFLERLKALMKRYKITIK